MTACATPLTRGPHKGDPATGTPAGPGRHRRAGESLCDACRETELAYHLARRQADPELYRAASKKWYDNNRDVALANNRRWVDSNREQVNAARRDRHRANPERARAKDREKYADPARRRPSKIWRAANPERARALGRISNAARRARKRDALVLFFTDAQLAEKVTYWGSCCWMCGGAFEAIDHVIPLAGGGPHCLANLRPACRSCNASKGAKDWREVAA